MTNNSTAKDMVDSTCTDKISFRKANKSINTGIINSIIPIFWIIPPPPKVKIMPRKKQRHKIPAFINIGIILPPSS